MSISAIAHPAPTISAQKLLLSGLDSLCVSYDLDLRKGHLDFDELSYERERLRDPKASLDFRVHCQGRALYGTLKGFAALLGEANGEPEPLTFQALLELLPSALAGHHSHILWRADVNKRLQALRLGQW